MIFTCVFIGQHLTPPPAPLPCAGAREASGVMGAGPGEAEPPRGQIRSGARQEPPCEAGLYAEPPRPGWGAGGPFRQQWETLGRRER